MPKNFDLINLSGIQISSSISFSVTNDYNLIDEALTNYTMDNYTGPTSSSLSDGSYDIQILANESNILSLPNSLNQSLTVSPGQILTLDLP